MGTRGYITPPRVSEVLAHSAVTADNLEAWMVLPNNAIVNGNFAADASWTKGVGWTIGSGVATATGTISTDLSQTADPLVAGNWYRVRFEITAWTEGSIWAVCGTKPGTVRTIQSIYEEDILANGAGFKFSCSGFTGSIDEVSATLLTNEERSLHLRQVYVGYDAALTGTGQNARIRWTRQDSLRTMVEYLPGVFTQEMTLPFGGIIADPGTLIDIKLSASGTAGSDGRIEAFYGGG